MSNSDTTFWIGMALGFLVGLGCWWLIFYLYGA